MQHFLKKLLTRTDLADILTIVPVRGYSSAGRALDWQSRGQRFDPAYLHQKETVVERRLFSFFSAHNSEYLKIKQRETAQPFLPVLFGAIRLFALMGFCSNIVLRHFAHENRFDIHSFPFSVQEALFDFEPEQYA